MRMPNDGTVKRMDHVRRGHLDMHDFTDGHYRFVVDGQLANIAGLQVRVGDHLGIEFKAATLILGIGV